MLILLLFAATQVFAPVTASVSDGTDGVAAFIEGRAGWNNEVAPGTVGHILLVDKDGITVESIEIGENDTFYSISLNNVNWAYGHSPYLLTYSVTPAQQPMAICMRIRFPEDFHLTWGPNGEGGFSYMQCVRSLFL